MDTTLPKRDFKEENLVYDLFSIVNHCKNLAQFNHWFAQHGEIFHRTIGRFYDDLSEVEDSIMEQTIGATGIRLKTCTCLMIFVFKDTNECKEYFLTKQKEVRELRGKFNDLPEIQNEIDNLVNVFNQLKFLEDL